MLVTYLAFGLWLSLAPVHSGEMQAGASLTQIFYFLSASLIALIFIVREKIYCRPAVTSSSQQEILKLTSAYESGHLLIYVPCEAIGLFGLLLFLAGSVWHFLNLTLVSIIVIVVLYPRRMMEGNL